MEEGTTLVATNAAPLEDCKVWIKLAYAHLMTTARTYGQVMPSDRSPCHAAGTVWSWVITQRVSGLET
jgi:hypothetical protein